MLEDKNILQFDATLMTGMLILLTISNIAGNPNHVTVIVGLVAFAIIPVGISAALIILHKPSASAKAKAKAKIESGGKEEAKTNGIGRG